MADIGEPQLEQLLARVVQQLAKCFVDTKEAAVRRRERHSDRSVVEALAEALLAVAGPLVRARGLLARELVEAPGHQAGGPGRAHEGSVDGRPLPRVCLGVRVV